MHEPLSIKLEATPKDVRRLTKITTNNSYSHGVKNHIEPFELIIKEKPYNDLIEITVDDEDGEDSDD